MKQYVKGELKFPAARLLRCRVSEEACSIKERMLGPHPVNRPTARECLCSTWLANEIPSSDESDLGDVPDEHADLLSEEKSQTKIETGTASWAAVTMSSGKTLTILLVYLPHMVRLRPAMNLSIEIRLYRSLPQITNSLSGLALRIPMHFP